MKDFFSHFGGKKQLGTLYHTGINFSFAHILVKLGMKDATENSIDSSVPVCKTESIHNGEKPPSTAKVKTTFLI